MWFALFQMTLLLVLRDLGLVFRLLQQALYKPEQLIS